MPGSTRRTAARFSSSGHGSGQGRLGLVEGHAFGENGIVTSLGQCDQRRLQRRASFACEICRVTGASQEPLHFARPILFLDLDESLQLAQVMGVAQGVQHAWHRVIGLPVIMDDDAGDIRQKAAALGADAIEGQQRRGGDMQPSRRAADPKAGLVHVLDRRRGDVVSHDIGEVSEAPGTVPADPGDGRGRQLHPEEIGHQLDQTLLGQQLVVQEIEHERADPRAVLHRRVDAVRKQRTRLRAASSAPAIVRTMLGDDERPRLGQIEHLPGAVADARVRIQARAAPGAGRRVMIDHDVGIGDLPQRLAFVALLPARFLAGPVPQARYPRRLLQPITRRRLAAVRTVQPEPALELRQPRLQRRILGLQGRDQREKVVHRWRTRRRFASHPMLESEPVSSVERIFSPNPAVAQPGQLRNILWHAKLSGEGFEGALSSLQNEYVLFGKSPQIKQRLDALTQAVIGMFTAMQAAFSRQKFDDQDLRLQRFLARFDSIFTLNQDTFLETHYAGPIGWSERWYGSYLPYMKFIKEPAQHMPPTSSPHGLAAPGVGLMLCEPLTQEAEYITQENYQPIYKLHGSYNWFAEPNGERLLVIGGNKTGSIKAFHVLAKYHAEFQTILSRPNTHLMIIGYSFGDAHINCAIQDAASKGMKIFVIDPSGVDVIDKRNTRAPIREPVSGLMQALMPSLIGASRRSLKETIYSDLVENEKVMRFFEGQPEIRRVPTVGDVWLQNRLR